MGLGGWEEELELGFGVPPLCHIPPDWAGKGGWVLGSPITLCSPGLVWAEFGVPLFCHVHPKMGQEGGGWFHGPP